MYKTLIVFSYILLLSACANPNAGVVFHDDFDFSAVKNYSLYGRNSTFSETQGLLDTRRNAIEIAIERTMATKMFSYTTIEKADVIVTYHIFDAKHGDFSKYNKAVNFCNHCLGATTWHTDRQYSTISSGDIVLDLIDPKRNRSIWRSIYSLNIKDVENSAKTNDKIKEAITLMLAQYPKNTISTKPSQ